MFAEEKRGDMHLFPQKLILEWIDEDIDTRAPFIASYVPPVLFNKEEGPCLARGLLLRYGSRADVRQNLMSNFSNEGWTGPESLHMRNKIEKLEDIKAKEDNKQVIVWINEYIEELKLREENAKIREERDYHG